MRTEHEIREYAEAMERLLRRFQPGSLDFRVISGRLSMLHWVLEEFPTLEIQESVNDLMQDFLVQGNTGVRGQDEAQG